MSAAPVERNYWYGIVYDLGVGAECLKLADIYLPIHQGGEALAAHTA